MKRSTILSVVGALLVAVVVTGVLWGKAHVPADKVQVCRDGIATTVDPDDARRGEEILPANDHCCVFFDGDACEDDDDCPRQTPLCDEGKGDDSDSSSSS